MANKTNMVNKLPAIFQTVTERKFFDATFDQVFSSKNSERTTGYIGRRIAGEFDPINDYYLPEPDKERTWYQLEPTAVSKDSETLEKTNRYFYDDIIDRLRYYGGDVGNHDRLFSSRYYSYAPPIDVDMFVNYQNYYWVPGKLPVIEISGYTDEIINDNILSGVKTYNTSDNVDALPEDLEFSNGLRVRFVGTTSYDVDLTIEGVGSEITLVEDLPETLSVDDYESVTTEPDYITMERGSVDANAWSRTNKWYHIVTLGQAIKVTETLFPEDATRSLRPIIEFEKDLELYNSGEVFIGLVEYYLESAKFDDVNNQSLATVQSIPGLEDITAGEIIVFPNDAEGIREFRWTVEIDNEVVSLVDNHGITDIDELIIISKYEEIGMPYYFDGYRWIASTNNKTKNNQPIEFALYDSEFNSLGDDSVYPGTGFNGSEIFSYKLDTDADAYIDTVLGQPIVYQSLGQLSDIVFNNDLQSDRYNYVVNNSLTPIEGYYYFRKIGATNEYSNSWYPAEDVSKQRVLDRFVIFDEDDTDFFLSVMPYNDDVIVTLNGEEVTRYEIIDRETSGINEVVLRFNNVTVELNDVIEARSFTHELLDDDARGYFEIPQQLDANPNNDEIAEQSYSDFVPHFTSIMSGQDTFEGEELGFNNFGDTAKDPTKGSYILQNESPLLKTMLTASEDSLDNVKATRFANNEYVNFKSKFLKVARQLDLRGFDPILAVDDISVDLWLEEIFNILTISKEFSDSFAYSYMISRTDLFSVDTRFISSIVSEWQLFPNDSVFVDLADPKNTIYLYKVVDEDNNDIIDDAVLLLADVDYTIDLETATVTWATDSPNISQGDKVLARIYENTPPAYIPATPAKLGMAPVFIPALEEDTTFTESELTIVGHDGSRTLVYGYYDIDASVAQQRLIPLDDSVRDARDDVLFELEKRIYNSINQTFTRSDAIFPIAEIRPGAFRSEDINRYSREEYFNITVSFISRWTAENKADYKLHEFFDENDWRTWNYSSQQYNGENLPGHWKGIFLYYYDTIRPDTHPWEMIGHSIKPADWDDRDTTEMWAYIEAGGEHPELYARPGLSSIMPVDGANAIRPVADIFGLTFNGASPGATYPWVYGDGAPVESAWYDSSEYKYSETEFLYLMRPAAYGEKFWDPANVATLVTGTEENDFQTLDIDTSERRKNNTQTVHGENIDNVITYRSGYQQWITDRILFLNQNVTTTFGDKIRNLDVNLGHKMAAFTDKDTISVRLESVSTESTEGNLTVPTTNYDVNLHTSPSVRDYVYSGVMIRASENGTYRIYGYDLLDQTFNMLPAKTTSRSIQVRQGGTPATFRDFVFDEPYVAGEYVRYQNKFYQCKISHTATAFLTTNWTKLANLPEVGGVTVSYRPDREDEPVQVPYSSVLNSPQDVFDFLIGYGAWLEQEGWKFENINELNQIEDWKHAGNQFLFWVVNEWEEDNVLLLSPGSTSVTLEVETGYPANVERMTNGVYSIMGKYGFAIDPTDTTINRSDKEITVVPTSGNTGVYYFRVSSAETEHVLMFDNLTEFNDTIYDPLLRVRQDRLKFTGTRTLDWFGKMEAGGYLIQNDGLIQNFENLTQSITEYYNTETALDEPEVDLATKHLVGYENKDYLDELEISDDVQYNFYQGYIREKGSINSVSKLLRSNAIQDKQDISFFEEWAFKLQDFAGSSEQVTIEFKSDYNSVSGDPQAYRLNHNKTETGYVKEIRLFNVEALYEEAPEVTIRPSATGINAEAVAILGDDKKIASIDIINPGTMYTEAPSVQIGDGTNADTAFSIFQADITHDDPLDTIIDIDIDDTDNWILRPRGEMVLPSTDEIYYQLPNAGYVHIDDVDFLAFDVNALSGLWENNITPQEDDLIWVAKNAREDWGVYAVINNGAVSNLRSGGAEAEAVDSLVNVERTISILGISTPEIDVDLGAIEDTKSLLDELKGKLADANTLKDDLLSQAEAAKLNIDDLKNGLSEVVVVPDNISNPDFDLRTEVPNPDYNPTVDEFILNPDYDSSIPEFIDDPGNPGNQIPNPDYEPEFIDNPLYDENAIYDDRLTISQESNPEETIPNPAVNEPGYISASDANIENDKIRAETIRLGELYNGEFELTEDPDRAELVNDGVTQVNDEIRDLTEEITDTEILLESQVKALAQKVSDEDMESASTVIDSDLALIDVDNDIMVTDNNVLTQNRRYLETRYKYETDGLELKAGLVKIKHTIVNAELDEEVLSLEKIYRYEESKILGNNTYALTDLDGELIKYSEEFADFLELDLPLEVRVSYTMFSNRRYASSIEQGSVYPAWLDNSGDWEVYNAEGNKIRSRAALIDTSLFENAFLRDPITGSTSLRLPVYDPFKGIIAGPADQNVDFKSSRDPARYNNSNDITLYDPTNMFDADQVGMLWWDLSDIRYLYYEQPDADATKELEYRRNNWGKVFPGSTADVYEWVESTRMPSAYLGTGTPRSETEYVKVEKYNKSLDANVVKYYFWVKDTTEINTNRNNRTLTALAVSSLILNPKAMAYSWFTPIQDTSTSDSFIISNADTLLSNNSLVVQVNYKKREGATNKSTQWQLLREGDRFSVVPDELWDKMVNSLVGYTDVLPLSDEYADGIPYDGGYVLPVPDTSLSASEQRGIEIRPQQSMYVDIFSARKILYQSVNGLVLNMKLWTEQFEDWDVPLSSNKYWDYVDWYEEGYDATTTNAKKQVAEFDGLFRIMDDLADGELVKVYPFVPVEDDRYEIYEYDKANEFFNLVRRQYGTFSFKPTIYTDAYSTALRTELREMLTTLKENVFVDEYVVNENLLFFAMVNYSFSEQRNIDWAFKTTYISFLQDNVILSQRPNYESDVLGEFISYVNEVKPYHTKLRDAITVLASTADIAEGTAYDDVLSDPDYNGRFTCEPVPVPFQDPIYPSEMVTESCRWVDDTVAKRDEDGSIIENNLLRNMAITIEFARTSCEVPGADCTFRPEFREGSFLDPLDVLEYDENGVPIDTIATEVIGYERDGNERYQKGEPVIHDLNFAKWDSSNTADTSHRWDAWDADTDTFEGYWDATEVNVVRYQNPVGEVEQDTELDSSEFNNPDGTPEELLPADARETIVINVGYGEGVMEELTDAYWDFEPYDSELWDPGAQPPGVDNWLSGSAYRINITSMGWTEYTRISDYGQTKLLETVTLDATEIKVEDADRLPTPRQGVPGVVWIKSERIEYLTVVDNVLTDIRRGTQGTTPVVHVYEQIAVDPETGSRTGVTVFDGSVNNVIPRAETEAIDGIPLDKDGNQYFFGEPVQVDIEYGGPGETFSGEIVPVIFDPWFKKLVDPATQTPENPDGEYYRTEDGTLLLFENSPQSEFILSDTSEKPPE